MINSGYFSRNTERKEDDGNFVDPVNGAIEDTGDREALQEEAENHREPAPVDLPVPSNIQTVLIKKPSQGKIIIVEIHFNSYGFNKERLTKKWIDYRMSIFMKHTCRSLIKQTNKNFKTLVYYANSSERFIKNALSKYKKLPSHIQFIRASERRDRILKIAEGSQYLYLVRVDSDDMYRKNFIAQLHAYKPKAKTAALINQRGFWYDSIRKRMAAVIRNSPPFCTLIYKTQDFEKGKVYKLKGHGSVIRLPHEKLKPRNYMVVIHRKNSSTKFRVNKKTDFLIRRSRFAYILKRFM